MNRNSIFNSRKFKYGSAATAFTVAFIAVVVIFNIIFSALARKYMWYIDLTKEQVYTLSEEAKTFIIDASYDPQFGARPLKRYIQHTVETIIARRIVRGDVAPGTKMEVTVKDGDLEVETLSE